MARTTEYTLNVSILDSSGEIGRMSINTAAFVEIDGVPLPAPVENLIQAIPFFSSGAIVSVGSTAGRRYSNVATGGGQREWRYLVRYSDNVTLRTYNFQIPCAKTTLATIAGTDRLDPTQTGYAEAVGNFEDIARSPDGNPITILEVLVLGGR